MANPLALHRLIALDIARGLALVAMIVYHAVWDGLLFGLIAWSTQIDSVMKFSAQIIAGSFLVIVGVSMALAQVTCDTPLLKRKTFWRRAATIALAAITVSLATTFALPQAPIYFGILHHIAIASVLVAAISLAHPFVAVTAAAGVVIVAGTIALEGFNHPALIWLGLGSRAPVTADWVPVFPWLAASLLGFAVAKHLLVPWLESRPPQGNAPSNMRNPLVWMGRNSLLVYLVHQPILIGLIYAYQWVT